MYMHINTFSDTGCIYIYITQLPGPIRKKEKLFPEPCTCILIERVFIDKFPYTGFKYTLSHFQGVYIHISMFLHMHKFSDTVC